MPIILCELEGNPTGSGRAARLARRDGLGPAVEGEGAAREPIVSARHAVFGRGAGESCWLMMQCGAAAPLELVRSTAQAASLSMVDKAVTAGVVSAKVAALTGEVLNTMLLNKLKLATAMFWRVRHCRRRDEPRLPGTRHGTRGSVEGRQETH